MPKVKGIPKVRFNLTTHKGDTAYIMLYFHYRGQRLKCAIGDWINPEAWDPKTQRVTKVHPGYVDINDKLDDIAAHTRQIYKDFNLGNISPKDFRNEIGYRMEWEARPEVEKKTIPTLFEFIEKDFLPESKMRANATWQAMYTTFQHLKNYAKEKKGGTLDYEDLTFKFFADFKKWLYAPPREHGINTAAKILKRIKQMARVAHKERRYHTNDDYDAIKIESSPASKFALSFEELELLYQLDLSESSGIEKTRDLFLIGCYTGLRFSDFSRIRPEHIETYGGQTLLNITTQKTGAIVSIPLFPIPLLILGKYNFKAPKLSAQRMNDYLKELGKMAGFNDKVVITGSKAGKRTDTVSEKWENISTKAARKSFATNFYLNGTPAIVLMQITGHKTEREFLKYIAVDGKKNAMHFADMHDGTINQ